MWCCGVGRLQLARSFSPPNPGCGAGRLDLFRPRDHSKNCNSCREIKAGGNNKRILDMMAMGIEGEVTTDDNAFSDMGAIT